MGNSAKYWFKALSHPIGGLLDKHPIYSPMIPMTSKLKAALKDFGFCRWCNYERKDGYYEAVYETMSIDNKEYLYALYAEASQLAWKSEFEELMKKFAIPIQRWMGG